MKEEAQSWRRSLEVAAKKILCGAWDLGLARVIGENSLGDLKRRVERCIESIR
jgi:hypothetical protein